MLFRFKLQRTFVFQLYYLGGVEFCGFLCPTMKSHQLLLNEYFSIQVKSYLSRPGVYGYLIASCLPCHLGIFVAFKAVHSHPWLNGGSFIARHLGEVWRLQPSRQLTSVNGHFAQAIIWHFLGTALVTVEPAIWVKRRCVTFPPMIYYSTKLTDRISC